MAQRPSTGGQSSTFALAVPQACRQWARARRLPLRDLVQQFVLLGAHVIDVLPPSVTHLPSAVDLLAAASVPKDAEVVLLHASDLAAPEPVVSPDELARVCRSNSLDGVPGVVARLRSYAMSCHAVHPDLDADLLGYMVVAYGVALGLPAEPVGAYADRVLTRLRSASDRRGDGL